MRVPLTAMEEDKMGFVVELGPDNHHVAHMKHGNMSHRMFTVGTSDTGCVSVVGLVNDVSSALEFVYADFFPPSTSLIPKVKTIRLHGLRMENGDVVTETLNTVPAAAAV